MKYDVFWSIYNSVFGIYSCKYLLYVLFAGIQNLYIYQMCDLSGLETGGWVAIRADINWRRRLDSDLQWLRHWLVMDVDGWVAIGVWVCFGYRWYDIWWHWILMIGFGWWREMVIILLMSAIWPEVGLFYMSEWSWKKLKIPIGKK